jgi:hypothetical protein
MPMTLLLLTHVPVQHCLFSGAHSIRQQCRCVAIAVPDAFDPKRFDFSAAYEIKARHGRRPCPTGSGNNSSADAPAGAVFRRKALGTAVRGPGIFPLTLSPKRGRISLADRDLKSLNDRATWDAALWLVVASRDLICVAFPSRRSKHRVQNAWDGIKTRAKDGMHDQPQNENSSC